MKKIVLATVFFAISLLSFAQNNYYWSGGKKHYLKEDPNVFIVKFTGTTKNIEQNVQAYTGIENTMPNLTARPHLPRAGIAPRPVPLAWWRGLR